jgi:hypothetical protein
MAEDLDAIVMVRRMTSDLDAEWHATFKRLDKHTADMERRIEAGEVTDPDIIVMVRRVRAAIREFYDGEARLKRLS